MRAGSQEDGIGPCIRVDMRERLMYLVAAVRRYDDRTRGGGIAVIDLVRRRAAGMGSVYRDVDKDVQGGWAGCRCHLDESAHLSGAAGCDPATIRTLEREDCGRTRTGYSITRRCRIAVADDLVLALESLHRRFGQRAVVTGDVPFRIDGCIERKELLEARHVGAGISHM